MKLILLRREVINSGRSDENKPKCRIELRMERHREREREAYALVVCEEV